MKRLSLRARLTLFYSAALCIMLAVFGALFYHALGLFVEQSLTSELHDEVAFLHNYMRVSDGELQLVFDPADRDQAYLIHVATRYYQVFKLPAGDLVVESEELDLLGVRPTPEEARSLASQRDDMDVTLPSERLRFQNSVIPFGDGATSFLVRVGIPLSPADAARRGFLRSLLFLPVPTRSGASTSARSTSCRPPRFPARRMPTTLFFRPMDCGSASSPMES